MEDKESGKERAWGQGDLGKCFSSFERFSGRVFL